MRCRRMKLLSLYFVLTGCSDGPGPAAGPSAHPTPSAASATQKAAILPEAEPVVKLFMNHHYAMRRTTQADRLQLIFALWADGRMVWSEKAIQGGPPFRAGRVEPEAVSDLLTALEKAGLFAEGGFNSRNIAFDISFMVMEIDHAGGQIHMESFHELNPPSAPRVERGPNGETLDIEKPPQSVLSKDQPRAVWDFVRVSLEAARPAKSEPVNLPPDSIRMGVRSRVPSVSGAWAANRGAPAGASGDKTGATTPAIKIFVNQRYAMRGPGADRGPRLVAALWPDGRMIWSENTIQGGPPYRSGRASAQAVDRMFDRLKAAGVFEGGGTKWRNWGPDASFTVMDVETGAGTIHMESWHELMGDSRSRAKTGEGLELPELEEAADVDLSKDRPGTVWDFVRASLTAMRPRQGTPVDVDPASLNLDDRSR